MTSPLRSAAFAVIGIVLLLSLLMQMLWMAVNVGDLRDYGSFIAAGKALEDGDNPYGVYEDTYVTQLGDREVESPNLNPPASLLVFSLLDEVDPYLGKAALNVLSSLVFVAIIWALLRDAGRKLTPGLALWLVSLAGFWHIIELGQIYAPLLAALTCAWIVQDRRPVLAGLLIGITIAIKPNFAIWPLLLFLGGERKISLSSLASAAALSAIPLMTFGPEVYRQWLDATREFSGTSIPNNASIVSIFARAGVEEAGIAISAILLLVMASWAASTRASKRQLSALGLVGALALGPITWSGYTLFALPVLLNREWRSWEIAVASTFIFPVWVVLIVGAAGPIENLLAGSIYGWGLVMLLGVLGHDAYVQREQERQAAGATPIDEPALAA